jgi:hypothetical protein
MSFSLMGLVQLEMAQAQPERQPKNPESSAEVRMFVKMH